MTMSLKEALSFYVKDPTDPIGNFNLAKSYQQMYQYASAISFYIRAAELTEDTPMVYNSLVHAADCFLQQGSRLYTVEGLLQYAITIDKDNPRAYERISNLYIKQKKWRECLLFATQGSSLVKKSSLDYLQLQIYVAQSKWNIGLIEDARSLVLELYRTFPKNKELERLLSEFGYPNTVSYKRDRDIKRCRFHFDGIENIKKNYSRHMQDMHVLSFLNGKKYGAYLEIGSKDPFKTNNTALLETEFGWKGITIDSNHNSCYLFSKKRRNSIVCADATSIDYKAFLDESCFPQQIDYLQINCGKSSLDVLKLIPLNFYRFSVIHFEHNSYKLGNSIRDQSREILLNAGYTLAVNDVSRNLNDSYEDWWSYNERADMQSLSHKNFIIPYMFYF